MLENLLPIKEKKDEELYWALIIEEGWVQAAIWGIEEKEAKILSFSSPTAWSNDEDLILAGDAVLSVCIQKLKELEFEPKKTVFGIPFFWTENGQIKREFLDKLKVLSAKLFLEPVGFVTLPEAIAFLLKSQEGSFLDGITVGLNRDKIEVCVFREGKLERRTDVVRSVSVVDDLVEALARFEKERPFPPRIVLYDGKEGELDEVRQLLVSTSWEEKGEDVSFLHQPKVDILLPEEKIKAVCLGGASEIAQVERIGSLQKDSSSEKEEEILEKTQDSGFVIGEDIKRLEKVVTETKQQEGKTIGEFPLPLSSQGEDFKKKSPFLGNVIKLKGLSEKVRSLFLLFRLPFKVSILPLFLLFFLISGFLIWLFVPKAVITVYVAPQKIIEDLNIDVSPDENVSNALWARQEGIKLGGEKSKETTGTKTVGEKARGKVTIYRVGSMVNLEKGTHFYGPNKLTFVLDDNVVVASGSAISPGMTEANLTASEIGAQYNIPSGTTLSIEGFGGEMQAKNNEAFLGGSSREIPAVSKEDILSIKTELEEELKEKIRDSIKSKLSEKDFLLEDAMSFKIDKEEYSAKEGDEAEKIKLNLSLQAEALVVEREKLFEMVGNALKEKIPQGFVLRESQVKYHFKKVNKEPEKNLWKIEFEVEANLLPDVNIDEVKRKIAGRYPPNSERYLKDIPGFTRVSVRISPNFPGKLGIIPIIKKNIQIEIAAER